MAFSIVQKFVRLFSQQNYDDVQIKMTSIFNGTTNSGAVEAAMKMSREDLADSAFSTVIRGGLFRLEVKTKIELTEQGILTLCKYTARTQIVVAAIYAVAFCAVAFLGAGYFLTSHTESKDAASVLKTMITCTAGLCAFAI